MCPKKIVHSGCEQHFNTRDSIKTDKIEIKQLKLSFTKRRSIKFQFTVHKSKNMQVNRGGKMLHGESQP